MNRESLFSWGYIYIWQVPFPLRKADLCNWGCEMDCSIREVQKGIVAHLTQTYKLIN